MNQSTNQPEVQAADPAARKRAIWLVGAAVLLGLGLLGLDLYYQEQTENIFRAIALHFIDRPQMMFFALLVLVLPMVAVSVYIFVQAARIVKSERMPYPGQKVIRDTAVLTGKEAVQRGRAIQFLAVFMTIFSLLVPFIPIIMMLYFKQVA